MKSSSGTSWSAAGSTWARNGRASSSTFWAAGKPVLEASISGPRFRKNVLRSGASLLRSISVGLSSRAAGRSCVTSGSVSFANSASRRTVSRDSSSKVGSAMKASLSCSLRAAVVANTAFELRISERSWP